MADLKNIWINSLDGLNEIRIDWDNDRHQAIKIESLDPESVHNALLLAAMDVISEKRQGFI